MNETELDRRARTIASCAVLLAALAAGAVLAAEPQDETPAAATGQRSTLSPVVQLMLDPTVQSELQLAAPQRSAIEAAYLQIAPQLWRLRDLGTSEAVEKKHSLATTFEGQLTTILRPEQDARLRQIALQARGWSALTEPALVAQLGLRPEQVRGIEQTVTAAQSGTRQAWTDESPATRGRTVAALKQREGEQIQRLLSPQQRQALVGLVGARYDLSQVRPLWFTAPELAEVDAWVRTQPLTFGQLKGKVVAFHFWAFGCINCIRNLPHYNRWHDDFASRGLVLLGMHTPETQAERSAAGLEAKVAEFGIEYPVAMDHQNLNWNAWANSLWPSVYLVDKRGRVRYWWYGELNWQGAEGEKLMRERIGELLAEEGELAATSAAAR